MQKMHVLLARLRPSETTAKIRTELFLLLTLSLSAWSGVENTLDQVVSVFENGTISPQYCYIENINDGRGFTAGRAGFTTATGDLYDLIRIYDKATTSPTFRSLLPRLKELAIQESGSTRGIEALPKLWKKECKEKPEFRKAQDAEVNRVYKSPARGYMRSFGFSFPLTYLIFFDSLIQHGDGDDPDSFSGILKTMKTKPLDERAFLLEFLKVRYKILSHASDPETRAEWRESRDRVQALRRLLLAKNVDLTVPFTLRVWEEDFKIP